MSDFLKLLMAEDAPEAREVSYNGQAGTVYFRHLSAGQLEKVLSGMKGESGDTSEGARGARLSMLMVFYCVCDEHGKRRFLNFSDVEKIPADRLTILAQHASEVNAIQEPDAGKA